VSCPTFCSFIFRLSCICWFFHGHFPFEDFRLVPHQVKGMVYVTNPSRCQDFGNPLCCEHASCHGKVLLGLIHLHRKHSESVPSHPLVGQETCSNHELGLKVLGSVATPGLEHALLPNLLSHAGTLRVCKLRIETHIPFLHF